MIWIVIRRPNLQGDEGPQYLRALPSRAEAEQWITRQLTLSQGFFSQRDYEIVEVPSGTDVSGIVE